MMAKAYAKVQTGFGEFYASQVSLGQGMIMMPFAINADTLEDVKGIAACPFLMSNVPDDQVDVEISRRLQESVSRIAMPKGQGF